MNEQLEKFAKQAPLLKSYDYPDLRLVDDDQLERFAELVRADERAACVKIALRYEPTERSRWVQYAADEMRARGDK